MAGFEIGGTGNEYDKYLASSNGPKPKQKPGKKPKLTPEEKRKLQEMLKDGKLRPPKQNTKYGVNTPQLPPQTPPGSNTKYGVNTPQWPTQIPPNGGSQTKYGINFPKK